MKDSELELEFVNEKIDSLENKDGLVEYLPILRVTLNNLREDWKQIQSWTMNGERRKQESMVKMYMKKVQKKIEEIQALDRVVSEGSFYLD